MVGLWSEAAAPFSRQGRVRTRALPKLLSGDRSSFSNRARRGRSYVLLAYHGLIHSRHTKCIVLSLVQMDSLIDRMESGLRLKILSSTRRKNFFAHLKRAQQVHFANKVADPGKCMVTSIHPAGVGGGHSKHDVVMYTEEAFRLRRRLAKLQRKIVISGRLDR
jgi:hypothetical protein